MVVKKEKKTATTKQKNSKQKKNESERVTPQFGIRLLLLK